MKNLELKNNIIEIKNSLNGLNCRVKMTEDRISKLDNRATRFNQTEQQRGNTLENDVQSQRLWDSNERAAFIGLEL